MNLLITISRLRAIKELLIFLLSVTVLSCAKSPSQIQQDSLAIIQVPPHRCFKQQVGNEYHAAAYYSCDKYFMQCCCGQKK